MWDIISVLKSLKKVLSPSSGLLNYFQADGFKVPTRLYTLPISPPLTSGYTGSFFSHLKDEGSSFCPKRQNRYLRNEKPATKPLSHCVCYARQMVTSPDSAGLLKRLHFWFIRRLHVSHEKRLLRASCPLLRPSVRMNQLASPPLTH